MGVRKSLISTIIRWFSGKETLFKVLLIVSMFSLIYVISIGYITSFSLLYGSDYPGVYSISDLNFNILTPDILINTLAYVISFGDITLSFYIYFFLCTFTSFLVTYYFCKYVLHHFTSNRSSLFSFPFIGIFLYALIPTAMAWTYYSVLRNVSLGYTLFTMSILIMLIFYEKIKNGEKIRISQIIFFPSIMAFSSGPPPNGFRIIFIYFVLGIVMFSILLRQKSIFIKTKGFAIKILFFLFSFFIFYLYYDYNFILNFKSAFQQELAAGANLSGISNYYGDFNGIQNVIRLLGISNWAVNPFNDLYWNVNLISFFSYIWPILALFIPVILILKKKIVDRALFISLYSLLLIAIVFATSLNPPFGQFLSSLYKVIPFGVEFLPSGFITNYVLSKIYLMMAIISLYFASDFIDKRFKYKMNTNFKILWKKHSVAKLSFILIILTMFSISSIPLVNGQAYHTTWGGDCEVYFHIPNSYTKAEEILHTNHLNALLLPDLSPYITTSYGYKGSVSFFSNFFGQNYVLTISNFYGIYANNSGRELYYNLTHPIVTTKNNSILNLNWTTDITNERINSLILIQNVSYGTLETYANINNIINFLSEKGIIKGDLYVSDQVSIFTLNLSIISNLSKENTVYYK